MSEEPQPASPWRPLGHAVFRALWIAGLVSDVGAWMHDIGESWLMTSLSPSPLLVALLQSADSLAIFLFALPAGAFADVVDRRRLAIWTQAWLLVGAGLLGVLSVTHHMTPWRLIGLAFVMGIGTAFDGPVWQAIVSEVVPRKELPAAITLGGLSFNLARAAGPALGGLVVAASGPFAVFLLNAVSFAYGIVVLVRWRRPPVRTGLPAERIFGAMQSGLRFVRHSPDLVAIFVRSGVSLLGASCLLALLPLFARRELGLGSFEYGALMGCMGLGSVVAATVVLPRARSRLSPDGILAAGAVTMAAGLLSLALAPNAWVGGAAMFVAGLASMSVVSSLNVAVQMASPPWVQARVLSVHLLVFQGAVALGSIGWGALAARTSIRTAMATAAGTMVAGLLARQRFRLGAEEHDFSPSMHWPKPMLACDPDADDGPVLVTVEYRVPEANARAFLVAAEAFGQSRRRFGAYQWAMFRDPAALDRFVEVYLVESWGEHLRQHDRVSVEQQEDEKELRALLTPGSVPAVTHLIAARPVE
ncbi:MAG TPA: MFS transporter, partial [Polyangiaceae bacterium]|nr:MFS transporter [Polyangiaceae bacterium]